jgi:hypothetical protein
MRAQTQTIAQRPQMGIRVDVGGLDWLHRLYQWFRGLTRSSREIPPVSLYGTWMPERERFRPFLADAALDIVISQRGTSWSTQLYNSTL